MHCRLQSIFGNELRRAHASGQRNGRPFSSTSVKSGSVDSTGSGRGAGRTIERSSGTRVIAQAAERRIEHLEAKLGQKNEVIAELMEENIRAKKANGEL